MSSYFDKECGCGCGCGSDCSCGCHESGFCDCHKPGKNYLGYYGYCGGIYDVFLCRYCRERYNCRLIAGFRDRRF